MSGNVLYDLVAALPMLAVAYGVVMGAIALATGWQLLSNTRARRHRRDTQVSPTDADTSNSEPS